MSGFGFKAIPGKTVKVTASTTASAVAALPATADAVSVVNTDATNSVFLRVTPRNATSIAVVDEDIPVLPGMEICYDVPCPGSFSVVASAGTPIVYVTPGRRC